MQTYEITVSGRVVYANSADTTLVRTSIGIDKIHVLFDNAEWTSFPVRVTFANGDTIISTSLVLTQIDAPEWAAEAECEIPWEVIQDLGGIRITFQGTDASGNHIITEASGEPLTIVEAGDVGDGTVPSPAPSIDEWNQAYANAMAAAVDAESAAEQVDDILHSTDAQTLEELLEELGMALRYKGTVDTFAELPNDAEFGDTYNVVEAHEYYPQNTDWTWTGTAWNALGGELAIDEITPEDVANIAENPSAYIDGDLPGGAKRLEYIVSDLDSQTQVAPSIDTGIPCNAQNLRIEVKYENVAIVSGFLFGDSSIPESATFAARCSVASNSIEFESGDVVWSTDDVGANYGVHTVALLSSGTGYVDGVEYAATETIGTNPSTTIKLCGTTEAFLSGARAFRGKLYYARIWVDGALALDLVPAIANDVACMYDRVSGDFFASTTSRAFTAGPELDFHLLLGQSGFAAAWIEAKNEFADKSTATASKNGLMSSVDKSKLDAMPESLAGSGLVVDEGSLSLGDIVTDSCDGPIYSVDAEGWSEQASTVGKNLLNINASGIQRINGSYSASGDSFFVTKTTAGSATYIDVPISGLSSGSTYSISCAERESGLNLSFINSERNAIWVDIGSGTHGTFTANDTYGYFRFYLTAGKNADTAFKFKKPQLEAGSTATEWEPYTGLAPSPSPEFPQSIEVCRGRNLLPNYASSQTIYGVTFTVNSDNSIATSGIASDTAFFNIVGQVDAITLPAGTYTLNGGNMPSGYQLTVGKIEAGATSVLASAQSSSTTFTISATTDVFAYIRIASGTTANFTIKPQLELGSTPTPYVPFGHVGLEVQGRNLWDEEWEAGTVNPSNGNNQGDLRSIRSKNLIPVSGDADYSISVESVSTSLIVVEYDNNGRYLRNIKWGGQSSHNTTFHTNNDAEYIRFATYGAGPTTYYGTVYKNDIQLELGSTAHDYQPYLHETRAIPLPSKGWAGGLPDGTADALAIDSAGKWEWTNNADEVVFDGSSDEGWVYDSGDGRVLSGTIPSVNAVDSDTNRVNASLSNVYKLLERGATSIAGKIGYTIAVSSVFIRDETNATSLSNWCTWLSTNPITVLYPLATPTTEHGYVDLPMDIPVGASIDIPELRECNVKCFVPGAKELAIHAANWGERARYEDEAIEDAIAELVDRVAALENA